MKPICLLAGLLRTAALIAALTLTGAAACARAASSPSAALALATLNAQRAANGIPAGLTEDPALSADCAAHDHYMALNHELTHYEVPGNPGYTAGGDYAGRNAVLAQGADWSTGNPYESAPLHLDQLLAPRLVVLGSADAEGYTCTTTFPGWTRASPPALTVYTYPGPGASIYASEVAREAPWTPGQLVALPEDARTGPVLLVFVDAPGQSPEANPAGLSGAALTGPSGPVAVRTVDGTTPLPGAADRLAPYIAPGGFIIPVSPLRPGALYRAHVVVAFAGTRLAHDWSFTTLGRDPRSVLRARGDRLQFSSRSPAPIRVLFTRAGGGRAPAVTIRPGRSVRLHLRPGSWRICGHQTAARGYGAYSACLSLTVAGRPALRIGAPTIVGGEHLSFPLHFGSVLRGRRATLTLRPLPGGRPSTRTIKLRRRVLLVALPAPGHGVLVRLTTAAFVVDGSPWTAASASYRYLRP